MRETIYLPGMLPLTDIFELVAAKFNVTPMQLCSENRAKEITKARQTVFYLACQSGRSLTMIGRIMRRDHTTVLHGRRVVEGLLNRPLEKLTPLERLVVEVANEYREVPGIGRPFEKNEAPAPKSFEECQLRVAELEEELCKLKEALKKYNLPPMTPLPPSPPLPQKFKPRKWRPIPASPPARIAEGDLFATGPTPEFLAARARAGHPINHFKD